jgi:Flp pilus assembly protein TadG
MMLRRKDTRRAGSTLIESALVYPVLFVVVLGIIMLGMATFRYQQVAHAAREGSRWAAVHGTVYAKERTTTPATPQQVYDNAILPQLHGAQPGGIRYEVHWRTQPAMADGSPDKRPTRTITVTNAAGAQVAAASCNYVTVTVIYDWNTILFGTIPVTSTSVSPIFY